MQRATGQLENVPLLEDGTPANRLNFQNLEEQDVVQGLLDYASLSDAHRQRLIELYAQGRLKPFGDTLDVKSLGAAAKAGPGHGAG
jgi:hypothetical protein